MVKLPDQNLMLDFRLFHYDGNACEPSSDLLDPIVLAEYAKAQGYGLVESSSRHFDGVFDSTEIAA